MKHSSSWSLHLGKNFRTLSEYRFERRCLCFSSTLSDLFVFHDPPRVFFPSPGFFRFDTVRCNFAFRPRVSTGIPLRTRRIRDFEGFLNLLKWGVSGTTSAGSQIAEYSQVEGKRPDLNCQRSRVHALFISSPGTGALYTSRESTRGFSPGMRFRTTFPREFPFFWGISSL